MSSRASPAASETSRPSRTASTPDRAPSLARIDLSPIETVFSTDTVDNPNIIGHPKFKTISVAPMFAETIMRFYNYESINSMFSQLPENIVHAGFELADLTL